MRLPASERVRWLMIVVAAAMALAALNIWWVMTYRHGYPLDIDEAGYTVFGLIDYLGLHYGGLHGWWDAIQTQPKFAPLLPALTSLALFVKTGPMDGFIVLTVFLVVLTVAVYAIAERLAGPRLGTLAALVAATCPGAFAFSREYIFALPTAALLACAVYALMRSDGLRSRRWALACGAALGLMLLARTMAIVYVPGVLAAGALALVVRSRDDRGERFFNLALLVVTGIAVAATWYARNLTSVIDYLTNYGYGSKSRYYGEQHSLISWGRLRSVGEHMTAEDLFLPLAVLLAIGLIAITVVVIRSLLPRKTRRSVLTRLASTDAASVAIVFAAGYAGLMTSQNGGDGFTFPLAVLLPPLGVLAIHRFKAAAIPAIAALALIASINVISTSTIWGTASRTRLVSLPGIAESLPVTKGVPKAVFALRLQLAGPETIFNDRDIAWLRADRAVLALLVNLYGPTEEAPVVAFGSRNRGLNSNTVQLASVKKYKRGIPFVQLEAEPNDSVSTYVKQLTDPTEPVPEPPTVLITMSRNTDDFPPLVTQSYVETAARTLGFQKIQSMLLPDGRRLYVWQKGRRGAPA